VRERETTRLDLSLAPDLGPGFISCVTRSARNLVMREGQKPAVHTSECSVLCSCSGSNPARPSERSESKGPPDHCLASPWPAARPDASSANERRLWGQRELEMILSSAVAPRVRGDAALIRLFMSFVARSATMGRECAATKCWSAYDTHCHCPSSSLATGKRRKQCHCS